MRKRTHGRTQQMSATATVIQADAPRSLAPVNENGRSPSAITTVAWVPQCEMDLSEWSRAGQRLGVMNRCSPWWIGDWICYGNAKFGEKYSRAAKITDYDIQTLMNMVYVASHFEISRRRENLSWSHHEALASLSLAEQDRWLDFASTRKLSVSDLRQGLRDFRRGRQTIQDQRSGAAEASAVDGQVICPNCRTVIPLPTA